MEDSRLEAAEQDVISGRNPQYRLYFVMLSLFCATWLASDIAAIKMVSVAGITLTGGFIIFPFTTLFGLIIVEVYGYKYARQAIWSGLILNITFIIFLNIVYFIPSASTWHLNDQFKNILLPETRIVIASLFSFMVSEFLNSYLMAKMKLSSRGRSMVKRMVVSCAFSFLFDIICFLTLAFYGTMSNALLEKIIFYAYLKKISCQIILFPIVLYVANYLKKSERVDVYDNETDFNPFSLDNVYEMRSLSKFSFTSDFPSEIMEDASV